MFILKYLGNHHKVWPFLLGHCDGETVQFLIWIMIWQMQYLVFIGLSSCPVTVTSRSFLFFVGDPGKKNNIIYHYYWEGEQPKVYTCFLSILMQQQPSTSHKSTSAISQRHCTIFHLAKCHRTWKRQRSGSWRQRYP